jgi:polyisoprenyl-phosphate glycosyltransferase
MKDKQFISVVLTVSNSEDAIIPILKHISGYLHDVFEKFEIIIVDNASSDSTVAMILENKQQIYGDIAVISLPWHHRKEYAIQA